MESPIILPLDAMTEAQALETAGKMQGVVWGCKVNDLLLDCGSRIITELKARGRVFADAKLHDIPNTVANGVKKLDRAGADLITIHAGGGEAMIKAACEAAANSKILVVTVLTSLSSAEARQIYGKPIAEKVIEFAEMAERAGAYGIVCSTEELAILGEHTGLKRLKRVVPGIRPAWYGKVDDQSRKATPKGAVEAGADLLVIGRPIYTHENPRRAAELVLEELRG